MKSKGAISEHAKYIDTCSGCSFISCGGETCLTDPIQRSLYIDIKAELVEVG